MLAAPDSVRERCLSPAAWQYGFPHTQETWPGIRTRDVLTAAELEPIERWVRSVTGAQNLWIECAPDGAMLDHNVGHFVGADESGQRPHTDSTALCRYAAVIYLTPNAPPDAGTTFFRLVNPDGSLGGNRCPAPHTNLPEALGVRRLPLYAWREDVKVSNVYNRILLYRANIVHSASGYFGKELSERRLTLVFFWMSEKDM